MATKRDYYEVLGISRNAGPEDIKRAFRKLAMEYHPDRNKDQSAEARFKEIGEAYEVLSDLEKRQAYDRFGHSGLQGLDFGKPFDGYEFGGFGDIFDAFFGGTGSRKQPQRGNDHKVSLEIGFEEAAFGCEKEVEVFRSEICKRCGSSGAEPGSQRAKCPACGGAGEVRRAQRSFFGQFINVATCSQCHGEGSIVTEPCRDCRGNGRERKARQLLVQIPGGVDDGSQLRLSGEGDAGTNGGPPGNLYVVLDVQPHPFFIRDEYDLIYDLGLNIAQAALGCEVSIPTLDDKTQSLKVPAGTQAGEVFRLKGKGVPVIRGNGRGDLLVRTHVFVPDELTEEQRRLLEDLAGTFGPAAANGGQAAANGDKGIFGRIKDVLG